MPCLWIPREGQKRGERGPTHGRGNKGLRRYMAACLLHRKKSVLKGKGMAPSPAIGHRQ